MRLARKTLYFGHDMAGAQSPPIRHAYIGVLSKYIAENMYSANSDIKLLEIGSWLGASAITWAKSLSLYFKKVEIMCVDPWQPYFDLSINTNYHYKLMDQLARKNKLYKVFKHNIKVAGVKNMVNFQKGTSQEVTPLFPNNYFDIVYIDGSHLYADVAFDIEQAKRLVKKNGIICGDDLELQLPQVDIEQMAQAVKSNQDFICCKNTNSQYHPGVTKAVADAFSFDVSASAGFWYVEVQDANKHSNIDLSRYSENLVIPEHIEVLPRFVEEYEEYNIFKHAEGYCAIQQSIGEVPINLTQEELATMYGAEEVFFCNTLFATKSVINELVSKMTEETMSN